MNSFRIYCAVVCSFNLGISQALNPINLFKPEIGQTLTMAGMAFGDSAGILMDYEIVRKSGDSAFFTKSYPGGTPYEYSFTWGNGILDAPSLLGSDRLDTNGIYGNQMSFPQDYNGTQGAGQSGFTLNYVIQGYVFDTLLVSCIYMSYIDQGNICDFVTPGGYLAYTVVNDCFCPPGFGFDYTLDASVLIFIGGRPTPILAHGIKRGKIANPLEKIFDLSGRVRSHPGNNTLGVFRQIRF